MTMNCIWMLRYALTVAIGSFIVAPAWAQYQNYSSSVQYGTTPPQRTQLPQWKPTLPLYSPTPPTRTPAIQPTAAPYGYSPSEMPSVNPFANVRSQQQPGPVSYSNTQQQSTTQYQPSTQYYQPAAQSYGMYPVSGDDPQQHAVGGGVPNAGAPYAAPSQQMAPTPQSNSYYDQPTQDYWSQPAYSFGPKAADCSTGGAAPCHSGWYGGAFGLAMSRSNANNVWLSYDFSNYHNRLLSSNDANYNTAGGAGAYIGHYFNCGQNSIQFVYWGLYPGTSEANVYGNPVNGMGTILHLNNLNYDAGTGPLDINDNFFSNAERHRVQRSYQLNNIELNLLGHNFIAPCCALTLGWTAGVRYVRFDEDFLYSSDVVDRVFTGDPEEVHYAIDVQNNLVGFQLGGQANYCVGPRLSLFANTKVGFFGNHMNQHSQIYGSNGQAVVDGVLNEWAGQGVDTSGTRTGYSMIGDLMIGGNWCLNSCWSINAGYRLVGINGVALATNQIPNDFVAALDGGSIVNPNGCVILHGAFAGLSYCY
jgi:hypothetical protein